MTTYLISVFHNTDLYELRLRGTCITAITRYTRDTRLAEPLMWDDLEDEVKEKILNEVRKAQIHEC